MKQGLQDPHITNNTDFTELVWKSPWTMKTTKSRTKYPWGVGKSDPKSCHFLIFKMSSFQLWGMQRDTNVWPKYTRKKKKLTEVVCEEAQTLNLLDKDFVNKCYLQETHFKFNEINRSNIKRWENIFHSNNNQKQIEIAILSWNGYTNIRQSRL